MKVSGWVLLIIGGVIALIGFIWYNTIPYYGPQNIPPIIFMVIGVLLLLIGAVVLRKAHARPDAALAEARARLAARVTPSAGPAASVAIPAQEGPPARADDADLDLARATDPETDPTVLADIVERRHDLRAVVAANVATYPELVDWLAASGDQSVTDAIASSAAARQRWAAAGDPATPLEELGSLAYGYPELRGRIASNPSAYDELRTWIAAAGLTPPSDTL